MVVLQILSNFLVLEGGLKTGIYCATPLMVVLFYCTTFNFNYAEDKNFCFQILTPCCFFYRAGEDVRVPDAIQVDWRASGGTVVYMYI